MDLAAALGVDLNPRTPGGVYASPNLPKGYETALGFLARTDPEALALLDLSDPDAFCDDEAFLRQRSAELGFPVVMVESPRAWVQATGIFEVPAFALEVHMASPFNQ